MCRILEELVEETRKVVEEAERKAAAVDKGDNTPPIKELAELVEAAGYKVISIWAEQKEVDWAEIRFTGVIDLKIAPATFFPKEKFPRFAKIPPCLIDPASKCREAAVPQKDP